LAIIICIFALAFGNDEARNAMKDNWRLFSANLKIRIFYKNYVGH
jgi:hypothetical protein